MPIRLGSAIRLTLAVSVLSLPSKGDAAGGTMVVARKGSKTGVNDAWPKGVGEIVNDSSRTFGWNSWFSEWPNDVNQYAFDVKSTDEVNRLIKKLAAVKAPLRQVRLSFLKAPKSLGWVTRAPKDNTIAVIFSIGDQKQIDAWYARVRKPFGVMKFVAAPVAVPPTLTLFVQNESIDLNKLEIPDGIDVSAGYVPTVFHRSNTTIEIERRKEQAAKPVVRPEGLDKATEAVYDAIEQFVMKRDAHQFKKDETKPEE